EPDAVDHRERLRPLPERLHRDRAVGAHQDAARGRDGHRTAFTHDRVPGAGGQDAPRADPQVAGARIALAAVRALDRDEPLALDGDVEIAPRVDDGALREARRVRPDHGVDPRGEPGSGDRLRAEGVQVGAEAGRRGVREIVAVDGLRVCGRLRAGHGEVDHPVHACNARPCDQRMWMTVWVTASAVEMTCALAWKFRWAVIILTSCAVRSTLDDSSAPDWTLPKDAVPASPSSASPDCEDSLHAVSPAWRRPCGLANVARATLPSAVDWPLVKRANTTPSVSTLTPVSLPVV